MMKGTPCSRGNYAPLKTSSKTRTGTEVQGLGPWRGLGQRPNLACFFGQWFGCGVCPTHNTNPAKRVRAWAQSRRPRGKAPGSAFHPPAKPLRAMPDAPDTGGRWGNFAPGGRQVGTAVETLAATTGVAPSVTSGGGGIRREYGSRKSGPARTPHDNRRSHIVRAKASIAWKSIAVGGTPEPAGDTPGRKPESAV